MMFFCSIVLVGGGGIQATGEERLYIYFDFHDYIQKGRYIIIF